MRDADANGSAQRIAVLVDADNVQSGQIDFAVREAQKHGIVTLRRAFGRLSSIKGRELVLSDLGFTAEVAFPPAENGKNAADLMMAQYAARLAERKAVEAIVLVSSDGDFAPIATGLAEAGVRTIGVGRSRTPLSFQNACTRFIPILQGSSDIHASTEFDMENLAGVINEVLEGNRIRLTALGPYLIANFGNDYKKSFRAKTLSELLGRLNGYRLTGEGGAKTLVKVPGRKATIPSDRPAASG